MGDDAEFMMEFEKHGPWWEDRELAATDCTDDEPTESGFPEAESYDGGMPLLQLDDGSATAVWGWTESIPLPFTFRELHELWSVGSAVLECDELPSDAQLKALATGESGAGGAGIFEVLVVSHDDEITLDAAIAALASPDRPLRERDFASMLEAISGAVQASPSREHLAFALTRHHRGDGI